MIDYIGLDHVVIRCRDLAAMRAFYADALGMAEERVREDLGLYQFRAGTALIDLVSFDGPIGKGPPPPAPGAGNMAHFCLRIADRDWDALIAGLRGQGVDTDDAPARRYGADGYGQSIYLRDPEGNTVELKMAPDADQDGD